jgi:GAF domain-containing protein/CheY-like chemotaxis protein
MSKSCCQILLVDDDSMTRRLVSRLLREKLSAQQMDVEIEEAEAMNAAKDTLAKRAGEDNPFDVIVLDWLFDKNFNGDGLLEWVKDKSLDTEVILLTGNPEERLQEKVLKQGAYFYADKREVLRPEDQPPELTHENDPTKDSHAGDTFALMIFNCVERLHVRRERRKTIDLISRLHKKLTVSFDLQKQLEIVVKFPRDFSEKIHKASIRMPKRDAGVSKEALELERVAYDGCHVCNKRSCNTISDSPLEQAKGIVGHVFKTAETYCRNQNLKSDPYYLESCPKTRSELCVPLKIGDGRVIGVLNLESPEEGTFTPTMREAIEAVAEVAAPSIRNAERMEEVMKMARALGATVANHVMGEGNDWFAAFDSGKSDLVELLCKNVLDSALYLTDAHLGLVYMVDRPKQRLRLVAEHGMGPEAKQIGVELSYAENSEGRGVCSAVARDGKPLRTTGDADVDRPLWDIYQSFLDVENLDPEKRVKSFLCVPIKLGEQVFGVINLEDERPNKFTPSDEMAIEAFANMVATSMANAALGDSMNQLRDLENSRERLKGRIDIYEMVAHDSKKPLALLESKLATARLHLDSGRYPEASAEVEFSQKMLLRAMAGFQETIELAKNEGENAHNLARFALFDMLSDIADELKVQFPNLKVGMNANVKGASACANPMSIKLVCKELLKNAAESVDKTNQVSSKDTTPAVTVRIDCRTNARCVIIGFEDDGPGIPAKDVPRIFDLDFSTKGPNRGRGLARSRSIVRLQLGDLDYIPVPKGSRFEVKLRIDM